MNFFALSPEVAGQLGENTVMDRSVHPPIVRHLHYEFDGWLGDDIVESFPCFVVTESLAQATDAISPSGVSLAAVELSVSATFRELYPGRELPSFRWLRVHGRAGVDDFGISKGLDLVVSERVLGIWQSFRLDNCDIDEYD